MNFVLQPWQLLLTILAGWVNRQQQDVIQYLRTENQVLKEKLGKRPIVRLSSLTISIVGWHPGRQSIGANAVAGDLQSGRSPA